MTKKHSAHSIRMKAYEHDNKVHLNSKMPILLRIDGVSFSTLTKGMNRPYDTRLMNCINDTIIDLCMKADGIQVCYAQSDEISILLSDWNKDSTQPWFGNNKQKLESVVASMFGVLFYKNYLKYFSDDEKHNQKIPYFDCRAWSLPFIEVNNYFYWRFRDNEKNFTSLLGRQYYSDKELFQKTTGDIQKMLLEEKGIDVNNPDHIPRYFSRGRCIYTVPKEIANQYRTQYPNQPETVVRNEWFLDENIPIFKEDKNFIERHFNKYFTEEDSDMVYTILEYIESSFRQQNEFFENDNTYLNTVILFEKSELMNFKDEKQKNKIIKELKLILKIKYPEYFFDFENNDDNKFLFAYKEQKFKMRHDNET